MTHDDMLKLRVGDVIRNTSSKEELRVIDGNIVRNKATVNGIWVTRTDFVDGRQPYNAGTNAWVLVDADKYDLISAVVFTTKLLKEKPVECTTVGDLLKELGR